MKNKQKAWRRPDNQSTYRKNAIEAAKDLAIKADGTKAKRFFLDQIGFLQTMRIGRRLRDSVTSAGKGLPPKLTQGLIKRALSTAKAA